MKNLLSTLLFVFALVRIGFGQAAIVSNVDWELDEEQEKIIITYDLAKEGQYNYFDISVKASVGSNPISPKALHGEIGQYIKSGSGKKIVWNVFDDVSELSGELTVEVIAYNPVADKNTDPKTDVAMPSPTRPKVPYWAGLGGVGAAGLGLIIKGASNISEASDSYNIYKEHRQENDAIYTELDLTRKEVFNEANKKNKSGSYLAIGGGLILATAGYIIINRMVKIKKMENRTLSLTPNLGINPGYDQRPTFNAGITLTCRIK